MDVKLRTWSAHSADGIFRSSSHPSQSQHALVEALVREEVRQTHVVPGNRTERLKNYVQYDLKIRFMINTDCKLTRRSSSAIHGMPDRSAL